MPPQHPAINREIRQNESQNCSPLPCDYRTPIRKDSELEALRQSNARCFSPVAQYKTKSVRVSLAVPVLLLILTAFQVLTPSSTDKNLSARLAHHLLRTPYPPSHLSDLPLAPLQPICPSSRRSSRLVLVRSEHSNLAKTSGVTAPRKRTKDKTRTEITWPPSADRGSAALNSPLSPSSLRPLIPPRPYGSGYSLLFI